MAYILVVRFISTCLIAEPITFFSSCLVPVPEFEEHPLMKEWDKQFSKVENGMDFVIVVCEEEKVCI